MSIATETAEATAAPDLADRFTFDICAFDMHFPCAVCVHREQPEHECCRDCRYYFK